MTISPDKWFQAIAYDDRAAVREMIVMGADLDLRDDAGRNGFQLASQYGYTDMMTTMLAARQMRYFKAMDQKSPVKNVSNAKARDVVSSFRKSA